MNMYRTFVYSLLAAAVILCTAPCGADAAGTEFPWSVGICGGMRDYEGDEPVDDAFFGSLNLSYDYSERWTFEGVLMVLPALDGSIVDVYESGVVVRQDNRLEVLSGVEDTSAVGLSLECMYHLTRWERFDPYFVVGAGVLFYADDIGSTADPTLNAGLGALYHFNDEWAVRADARSYIAGVSDTEANSLFNFGVVWTWGVDIPERYLIEGDTDSDGDGLSDIDEIEKYGTDPHHPDTDRDSLSDFLEVEKYGTNPLEADTDLDMLGDGEEVHTHKSNPLLADTDAGGVSDGHEVLEDGTDPLNGDDDLLLYSLNIEFDTNKSEIKPRYFPELDVIGKVMRRYPDSIAKIEGHADKRKRSSPKYNKQLSSRRANAVLNYLQDNWDVEGNRLSAEGFGFERPIAPNDPKTGNPLNRRVDVYIEGAEDADMSAVMGTPGGADIDTVLPPTVVEPAKGLNLAPAPEKGAPEIDRYLK